MPNRRSSGYQELDWGGFENYNDDFTQHYQRGIMEMPMQQPQVVYVQRPQQFGSEHRAGSRLLRFVAYGALVVGLMDVASIGARNGVNIVTHPTRSRDQQVHALFHVNHDDFPFSFMTNIKHITGK